MQKLSRFPSMGSRCLSCIGTLPQSLQSLQGSCPILTQQLAHSNVNTSAEMGSEQLVVCRHALGLRRHTHGH